jgi:hypothetical protein
MSENLTGKIIRYRTRKIVMQASINWQAEISAIAGAIGIHDSRESWLRRAARKAGLTEWHVKALFYGELKDPKWSVAYKVLSAAEKARLGEARRDAKQIADIYLSTAATLAHTDSDFHSTAIASLVEAARILGNDNTS